MNKDLRKQALIKYLSGLLAAGLVLFLPAGTFRYPNAWLFIALLFILMLFAGVYFLKKSPALLEKRLSTNETQPEQKRVILLSALLFTGGFVLAALDFRFGWSRLPLWTVLAASAVFLLAYGLYAEVMRENAYLSRTVEVQKNQQVVDTGLYGVVRHPMYFSTVLLFLSMPLVLGSLYSFLLFLLYPFLLVRRIKNEEQVLQEGLPGYDAYMKKVRWRLIPYLW